MGCIPKEPGAPEIVRTRATLYPSHWARPDQRNPATRESQQKETPEGPEREIEPREAGSDASLPAGPRSATTLEDRGTTTGPPEREAAPAAVGQINATSTRIRGLSLQSIRTCSPAIRPWLR